MITRQIDIFNIFFLTMAHFPNNFIHHFTHPGHPLTALNCEQLYFCNGCKTQGAGKRFRCHGCNFDLHEYCGTCPHTLSSFMHRNHPLTLMMATTDQIGLRICNVCADPLAGLFYQCKRCGFDVHPLCTQLPENLSHPLHSTHPLSFEFSPTAGSCGVCRCLCDRWRYRCRVCHFDIHLECISLPAVPFQQTERGTRFPFQAAPPQSANYYYPPGPGFAYVPGFNYMHHGGQPYHAYPYNFGPGFNYMYHGQPYTYPPNFVPQNQIAGYGNNGVMASLGNRMFAIVAQLGMGVLSNAMFEGLFSG